MENSDEQTRKKIKVLKTLLVLIPTPENNFNPAKREVELMMVLHKKFLNNPEEFSRLFWDSFNEELPHFPDEN